MELEVRVEDIPQLLLEVLPEVKKILREYSRVKREIIGKVGKMLGVEIEELDVDPKDLVYIYRVKGGDKWYRMSESLTERVERIKDEVFEKYERLIGIITSIQVVIGELLFIKYHRDFTCYYDDRKRVFKCFSTR